MTWRFISLEVILAVHERQLAEHGGPVGVRDRGLLDSALARPKNVAAYEQVDAADLAASYAFGIARNHPFFDGNKRTSFVAAVLFLRKNGFSLPVDPHSEVSMVEAIAQGAIDEKAFAAWLRGRIAPL